jgi:glucose repression mediator protein
MGSFRPTNSPRPDGRGPIENRIPSPKSSYSQHQPQYPHHAEGPPPNVPENGRAGPPLVAETTTPRGDERPPSVGPKRMREREEETAVKKQANEENRARLEDIRHRRASRSPHDGRRRNSSEARRQDEPRRVEEPRRQEEPRPANDSYHPSEAAHHPQTHSAVSSQLPPIQPGQSAPSGEKLPSVATPKEERPETTPTRSAAPVSEPERAARKMDVDENYDDSGEDDKKASTAMNGNAPPGEAKASTPTSAGPKPAADAVASKSE